MNFHTSIGEMRNSGIIIAAIIGIIILGISPARSDEPAQMNLLYVIGNIEEHKFGIHAMNPDGTHSTKITKDDKVEIDPVWSPDGKKIAFAQVSIEAKSADIYVMNKDGSERKHLSSSKENNLASAPTWSPDGKHIAYSLFDVTTPPGESTMHIMDADGKNDKSLGSGFLTIWTPKSDKLVFASIVKGEEVPSIYIMDADGKNRTDLKTKGLPGSLSADGKQLYFAGVGGNNQADLFVMDMDGKNQKRLTKAAESMSFAPLISPDGKHIYFTRFPKADDGLTTMQIFVMDTDGSNVKALTEDKKISVMGSGILVLLLSKRSVGKAGQ